MNLKTYLAFSATMKALVENLCCGMDVGDRVFIYAYLSMPDIYVDAFGRLGDETTSLDSFLTNTGHTEQQKQEIYAQAGLELDKFRSAYMENRESQDDDLPSEIYYSYAPLDGIHYYNFNKRMVCSLEVAKANFNAWFLVNNGGPLPDESGFSASVKHLFRSRNSNVPTLTEILLDPPWRPKNALESRYPFYYYDRDTSEVLMEFLRVYPHQTSILVYEPLLKRSFDGNIPLSGIKVFNGDNYWHFVTLGFSDILKLRYYNETPDQRRIEYTLRLKRLPFKDQENELHRVAEILSALAESTYNSGTLMGPYEYLRYNGGEALDHSRSSQLCGFITVPDAKVRDPEVSYGQLNFVELVGVTDAELTALEHGRLSVQSLYRKLGSDMTDYSRDSVI